MTKTLLQLFKKCLTIVGALMSESLLHQIMMVVNYLMLGRWMAVNGFKIERRVHERSEVFDAVAERVRDQQVLYLEFGVFRGDSMRYWSRVLKHPKSILHGFDSFEGLPEDWDLYGKHPKGRFDVGGQIPQIDDPRVKFFKGWFDQTLPKYQVPEHELLIITCDADLYSSTVCVLNHLRSFIKPGTFIYFDDMSRPDHEPRAFKEFMDEAKHEFRLVSTDDTLNYSFFECIK